MVLLGNTHAQNVDKSLWSAGSYHKTTEMRTKDQGTLNAVALQHPGLDQGNEVTRARKTDEAQ
jgi:hypothetical protein